MTNSTQCRDARKPRPVVRPLSWEWLVRPAFNQGYLRINSTIYHVTEVVYEDDNYTGDRLFDLRKSDGTQYRLCNDRDRNLTCDCADATYRGDVDPTHRCKHVTAVEAAYRSLEVTEQVAAVKLYDVNGETAEDYRNKSHDADPMPF